MLQLGKSTCHGNIVGCVFPYTTDRLSVASSMQQVQSCKCAGQIRTAHEQPNGRNCRTQSWYIKETAWLATFSWKKLFEPCDYNAVKPLINQSLGKLKHRGSEGRRRMQLQCVRNCFSFFLHILHRIESYTPVNPKQFFHIHCSACVMHLFWILQRMTHLDCSKNSICFTHLLLLLKSLQNKGHGTLKHSGSERRTSH